MIKLILFCCWACFVTLAGVVALNHFKAQSEHSKAPAAVSKIETKKTKEINVPKIKNSELKGYIIVQAKYSLDSMKVNAQPQLADLAIVDEIFKYLYSDANIDLDHLDKFDMKTMTQQVLANVNKRVGADAVTDLGIQELSFEANSEGGQRPPPVPLEKR
jgi:hypothetical protein